MFRFKKGGEIPHGVVEQSIGTIPLTKKERDEIAKEERRRMNQKLEAQNDRYQIIRSTQRIIPIEDIYGGIVVTKDHRYIKIMEFRPINFAYMDAETQNRIISLFYQTFKATPCNIQFKTFSRKADVENSIATVTDYYKAEKNPSRKRMLQAYIGLLRKTALSVGITRCFFVVVEFQRTISNDGSKFEMVVADLNAVAANVRSHMEQCGNIFIPALGNPDGNEDAGLHQLFYQLLNRRKSETITFKQHMDPIVDRYFEAEKNGVKTSLQATELIAPDWIDFTHHDYIVIDGKFYTFAYIPSNGFSQRVYAGWVATFVNAGEGIDVDMFFEHMSREAVFNKISTQLRLSRANAMDSHDTDSDYQARMEKISSSEYMLRGLSSGEEFYYLSMLITIVADTKKELDYKFDALKKRIEGQSMKIRRADFMMEECFDSCLLPLAKINKELAKKSHRNLLTSGVASCYPFISFEMQDPGGVMVGTNHVNNSLVTIDMFDTRAHANANAVILGSSGYGKTFTAQLFALRLSEMDTQVFIISPLKGLEDYGGGCKAVNGQFVSMDPSSDNNINIMDIRAPDDEDAKLLDDYEASGSFLTKKIHTILSFLHLVVRSMTQEEEQLIDGCLYSTYAKFGITRDNNSIYDKYGNYKVMPLLEDLYDEIKRQPEPEAQRIAAALELYVHGSLNVFNHRTNVDINNRIVCFDIKELGKQLKSLGMLVIQDQVWNRVSQNRDQGKSTWYFVDEFHLLLRGEVGSWSVEIWKRFRKWGGIPTGITQNIKDLLSSPEIENIFENSDFVYLLNQASGDRKILCERLNISNQQAAHISNAGPGEGLIFFGNVILPFVDDFPKDNELYSIMTTKLGETGKGENEHE